MADQVEEVKNKVDIVSLIGSYIDLKKAGRNFKANCPFHSEKTPSFIVSPELQIFKCFGCGESGDAISFLQKHEGMEFYEALKFLADQVGVKLETRSFQKYSEKEVLFRLNNLASKFYEYILLNHASGKVALSYLTRDRGLKIETIKTFRLGYSPDVSCAISAFLVDKKGFKNKDLERVGIAYRARGKYVDRFRGRVVFPLFDHRGNTAGFAGRILPQKEKLDLAKYINTPETPVYHKSSLLYGLNLTKGEIKKKKTAIVVEGELDLISSWQAGVKNVVALKGSAFTQDQARLISRFAKKVILALDTDVAGDAAARRGISTAENAGLEVKVVNLGTYKDPDDIARKDPVLYKNLLKKPIGVWDFVFGSIFLAHDEKSGAGKAKIGKEVVPILASITDEIVKAHYTQLVAKKLQVPTGAVAREMSKLKSQDKSASYSGFVDDKRVTKTRRELLEERLLSIAFQFYPDSLTKRGVGKLITTPLARAILEEYKKHSKYAKKFNPKHFSEKLPKELVAGFNDMFIRDGGFLTEDKDVYKKELALVEKELKILDTKEKLQEVGESIRKLEKEGKKKLLRKKEEEFAKLTHTLMNLEEEIAV